MGEKAFNTPTSHECIHMLLPTSVGNWMRDYGEGMSDVS